MPDATIPLKANRAYPSLQQVGGDLASHTEVLKAVKEAVEQHERRRGDPLDSFVRIRELIDVNVLQQLGDRVVKFDDTVFGGSVETEFVQDTIGGILVDTSEIAFTYNDSTPSITATLVANGVTFAKMQNIDGVSVLGRAANSSGLIDEITAAANDRLLIRTGDALSFGQLTAGMFPATVVPDSALSSNVALLDRSPQTFTGLNQFAGSYTTIGSSAGQARLRFLNGAGAADNELWDILVSSEVFRIRAVNDADTAASTVMSIDRTGTDIDQVTFTGASGSEFELNFTNVDINAAVDISSTLVVGSSFTVSGGTVTLNVLDTVLQSTSGAIIRMRDTDAAANQQRWRVRALNGTWLIAGEDDTGVQIEQAFGITKAADGTIALVQVGGATIDEFEVNATLIDFNGAMDISGTLIVGGIASFSSVLRGPDGARLTPTYSFTNDTDTGIWLASAGLLEISVGNAAIAQFSAAEIELNATLIDINGAVDIQSSSGVVALQVSTGYAAISGSSSSGTIALLLTNALPRLAFLETDAAADNQLWYIYANAERFNIAAVNDARSVATSAFFIDRTGTTIDLVRIDATEFEVNATTIDFNGALTVSGDVLAGDGTVTLFGAAQSAFRASSANPAIYRTTSGHTSIGGIDVTGSLALSARNSNAVNGILFSVGQSGVSETVVAGIALTVAVFSPTTEFEINTTTVDMNANLDLDGTTHTLDGTTITVDAATTLNLAGGSTTITMTGSAITLAGSTAQLPSLVGIGEAPGRTLSLAGTDAFIRFKETATPAADEGVWLMGADANGLFHFYTRNDLDTTGATIFEVDRTGTTVTVFRLTATEIELNATTLDFNGTADISGTLAWGGGAAIDSSDDVAQMESGSFTVTLTGMTALTQGTINWYRNGTHVLLVAPAAITGTSNSTDMLLTGIPAGIQPVLSHEFQHGFALDNGLTCSAVYSYNDIAPGQIDVFPLTSAASRLLVTSFAAAGTKGIPEGWSFGYDLS